jgi:hypothetical protein
MVAIGHPTWMRPAIWIQCRQSLSSIFRLVALGLQRAFRLIILQPGQVSPALETPFGLPLAPNVTGRSRDGLRPIV